MQPGDRKLTLPSLQPCFQKPFHTSLLDCGCNLNLKCSGTEKVARETKGLTLPLALPMYKIKMYKSSKELIRNINSTLKNHITFLCYQVFL